jgi:nitrogen fixation protein NifX
MQLRVAFASGDRRSVDQHFGAAAGFVIYAVDGERAKLVQVAEFDVESMDGNENKLPAKIEALAGCAAVYCLAVGASAVRQLIACGIQPMRLEAPEPIDGVLAQIGAGIREGGVPWIDKALGQPKDAGRFERMAEEGWQE